MSAKSAISKEIFAPLDERMLGAVQVKRRTKKKIPFLATGGQGEYLTYICLSGTGGGSAPPPLQLGSRVASRWACSRRWRRPGSSPLARRQIERDSGVCASPRLPGDQLFLSPLVLMKFSPPPLSDDIRSLPCWYPMRMAAFRSPCRATKATVTNKKPTQASITKVKQFEGSTSFVRRSQWMLEQLRQVNGIDPNRDSAEFDLLFENAFDQWVASTASEKCTFFQILHHTCQRYLTDRKPEFINCQSKIMGGNSILHSAADSVTSAVQKASQALNERGERLGRAEEKTEDMKNSAQQFAETAHKLAMKHKC
ncbi:syntaxin-binding protein 6 isoform X1 [Marmota monax]|uniref:syntaxin-binding protein 6 isoform X1 n=1 Tax=Marmota monax TaxID=9995 RepID=UPI0026F350FB|nr:syntaxin-binding protein 6 isoform X1 [Marmota monax]XP_058441818.1 syntaxin-binding protein 6 isoform X1 [Marmota monax]